jgi:DNA topoisomerase-1
MMPVRYNPVAKRHVFLAGGKLPPHLSKIRIPPAWTDVQVHTAKEEPLWVKGKDAKGRQQSIYSPKHDTMRDAAKFRRVGELESRVNVIAKRNEKNRNDPDKVDHADATKLIMHTGIRPGSDKDTGGEKKAYGATTLLGKHVIQDDDGVSLKFTGKKGVDLTIPVSDKGIADNLVSRAAKAGPDGKLFPNTSSSQLLSYTHSIGGAIKTKDFRTLLANRIAKEQVEKLGECCANEKDLKKATKTVAMAVAHELGNTPAVALKSYINPHVFSSWKVAA